MNGRLYTETERQMVADRYAEVGAKPLARELGRNRSCIVSLAGRLGVQNLRPWTDAEDAQLAEMRQRRLSTADIAAVMGRSYGAISKRLETLGLTVPTYNPQTRRMHLIEPHQFGRISTEVRWARERMAMDEHGWHPDLNPKEVSILNSLERVGPQSRRILSLSIGEPIKRKDNKRLMSHGGRSSMARLLARGLVAKCILNNGRKRVTIYALTVSAQQQKGGFQSVKSFNAALAARGLSEAS